MKNLKSFLSKAGPSILLPLIIYIILFINLFVYLNYQKDLIIEYKSEVIESITKLNLSRIDLRLKNELVSLEDRASFPVFSRFIKDYSRNQKTPAFNELKELLSDDKVKFNVEDYLIIYKDTIIFSVSQKASLNPFLISLIEKCKELKKPAFSDLEKQYFPSSAIYIYFITPIKINSENDLAFLISKKDFQKLIQPILSFKPFQSNTLETFLVRAKDDSVDYLSELNFSSDAPFRLKFPLTMEELPAVKALKGQTGLFEATNYRGKPVLSYAQRVENTNWFIITSVDRDEFLREYNQLTILFYLLFFFLIISGFVFIYVSYRAKEQKIYKEMYEVEKNLKQSIEKFKITVESLSEGVITTDIEGNIDYMNRMAENLTGWTLREAKGRKLEEVYRIKNELTGEPEPNPAQKVLKQGFVKGLANHTILITKKGNEIAVADTGAPLYDNNGEIVGVVIVFEDETERRIYEKLMIESEARFRNTLDNLIEGCQIISYDWRYLYLNKVALRQIKKSKEELIGQQVWDCNPGVERTQLFSTLVKCMNERTVETFESEFQYPDGSIGYFIVTVQPVEEGILILTKDITEEKLASKLIEEQEKNYRELTENISEFLFQIDAENYQLKFANKPASVLFEKDINEVVKIEKPFYEVISIDKPEEFREKFYQGVAAKENFSFESKLYDRNNRPIYSLFRFTLNKNSEGKIENIICIAYDFTKEKELQEKLIEREKFISSVFNTVKDMIVILSLPERRIILVNKAIEELFGYKPEEVIGKTTEIFYPDKKSFVDAPKKHLINSHSTQTFEDENVYVKKDGTLFWVETRTALISEDGNPKYAVVSARDITEKKKYIEEIIKAKEEAEEANRIKDGFISAMSHELRTPLNVIMGFSELLNESLTEADEEKKFFLEGILRGSKRLLRTGTLILDGARIDAKDLKIEMKNLPLNPFVESIAEQKRKFAEEKNLGYKVELSKKPIFIIGDEYAISVILDNIIDNAIKFSEKGTIEIRTEVFENKGRVIIKDEGVGISEKYLKNIYDKFSQEEVGTRRPFEGLGLGLYITKKFMDLCDAEIKFESEKNIGTTVILDFRLAEEKTDQ